MTAHFGIRLSDLNDPNEIAKKISGENSQNILKTSRSKSTENGDPRDVTLFTFSQILMGVPNMERPEDVMKSIMGNVFSGISSIADLLSQFGLGGLVPAGLQNIISAILPGRGGEGSQFSVVDESGNVPPFVNEFSGEEKEAARKVISAARNEVGTKEDPLGSNNQKYADIAGVENGIPWSMVFIMAMMTQEGMPQGRLMTPSVIGTMNNYADASRLGRKPQVGAVALMAIDSDTVNHAGIVVSFGKNNITLIEGSSILASNDNSLVGAHYVVEKTRRRAVVVNYLYPVYVTQMQPQQGMLPDGAFDPGAPTAPTSGVVGGIGGSFAWHPAQSATTDSRGPRPGARALLNDLMQRFPGTSNMGIYNYRPIRGGSSLSIHAEGRAIDLGVPVTVEGKRLGDAVFALIAPTAWSLGIQRVVWYRRIWQKSAPSGREYGGSHPHTDHLHIELIRSAATNLTKEQIEAIFAAHLSGGSPGPSGFANIVA